MKTNLTECINFVLKETHHFLLTSMVKETYFKLAALFPKLAKTFVGQIKDNHVWCELVLKDIRKNIERTNLMSSVCHSRPINPTKEFSRERIA